MLVTKPVIKLSTGETLHIHVDDAIKFPGEAVGLLATLKQPTLRPLRRAVSASESKTATGTFSTGFEPSRAGMATRLVEVALYLTHASHCQSLFGRLGDPWRENLDCCVRWPAGPEAVGALVPAPSAGHDGLIPVSACRCLRPCARRRRASVQHQLPPVPCLQRNRQMLPSGAPAGSHRRHPKGPWPPERTRRRRGRTGIADHGLRTSRRRTRGVGCGQAGTGQGSS